jgi:hypothetical protein
VATVDMCGCANPRRFVLSLLSLHMTYAWRGAPQGWQMSKAC